MRVQIARSGGFAAVPGLALEATLDLSGPSAHVTGDDSYARALTPAETQEVRRMLDPARFFDLPGELRSLSDSGNQKARKSIADQQQYDITLRLDDGREHTISVSETMANDLERLSPGLGKFLEWTKHEFDTIWQHKIQKR